MKILILANNDVGLYKFRKELIQELIPQNEVVVCLPKGEFIPALTSLGCQYVECRLLKRHGKNPIQDAFLAIWYISLIKRINPNVVLTYTIKPNIYGGLACRLLHVPYLVNITGLGTAVENKSFIQKLTLSLYRLGISRANKVFFQNTDNRDFMLKNHIVKGPYEVIPGSGVNLSQYRVTEYPNGEYVDFVFISRIMKEKGIDQYLEAAEIIHNRYPYTRFHICGFCEPEYVGNLESQALKGNIIYHGLVDDIAAIHCFSACTIHPTYYPEGLSNVLLESCACARPIITTNRPGCREIVEDGINGYIVKEKDSADLIEKIEEFLQLSWDTRKKMGLAGRARVEKYYDRKIVIEKYMKEIESI